MSSDKSSPFASTRPGPRLQFSLAMLMIVVTVVAVFCSLVTWLGWPFLVGLLLVGGPIGGSIVARVQRSMVRGDIAVWSGLITALIWVWIAVHGGFEATPWARNGVASSIVDVVCVALCFAPYAFLYGITIGMAWEVGTHVFCSCCRRIN